MDIIEYNGFVLLVNSLLTLQYETFLPSTNADAYQIMFKVGKTGVFCVYITRNTIFVIAAYLTEIHN